MQYELFIMVKGMFRPSVRGANALLVYGQVFNSIAKELDRFSGHAPANLREIASDVMRRIVEGEQQGKHDKIPAPDRKAADQITRLLSRDDVELRHFAAIVAAVYYETSDLQDDWIIAKSVTANPTGVLSLPLAYVDSALLLTELASYASWITWEDGHELSMKRQKSWIDDFKEDGDEILTALRERVQEGSESFIEMQKKHIEMTSLVESGRTELTSLQDNAQTYVRDIGTRYSEVDRGVSEAEAKLIAMEEKLATKSAKMLWETRATRSGWAYAISTALLVMLLIGVPSLALWKLHWTLEMLREIGAASMVDLPPNPSPAQLTVASLSRIVVIALPVALFIWMVRIIVRFNIRSLLLLDDAQQRHTMMDTYFHLIEKQGALKEDRALMLAALFRPAPGHGADNVDPPAFTDLLEKMPGK